MKHKVNIEGHIFVDAEDTIKAEAIAARWLLSLMRNNQGQEIQVPASLSDAQHQLASWASLDAPHICTYRDEEYENFIRTNAEPIIRS
jgi:hypothetical protein